MKPKAAGASRGIGHCFAVRWLLLSFFCFSFFPSKVRAADDHSLSDSARQLAERVAAIPGLHSPVHVELQGDETGKLVAGTDWQERFEQELEKRRVDLTKDANAAVVRVYATQTPTQVVFVARMRAADRDEVRMVTVNRQGLTSTDEAAAALRLERQLLYQTSDRILDATYPENRGEGGLVVLVMRDAELVALRVNDSGEISSTFALAIPAGTVGRDAHAELSITGSRAEVAFSAKACQFDAATGNNLKCRNAKPVWREPVELSASCDEVSWKLISDADDWTAAETLSAVPDGEAPPAAGLHSEFPGPILAIHDGRAPDSALVITRNLRTGNYELYKVTLACGD